MFWEGVGRGTRSSPSPTPLQKHASSQIIHEPRASGAKWEKTDSHHRNNNNAGQFFIDPSNPAPDHIISLFLSHVCLICWLFHSFIFNEHFSLSPLAFPSCERTAVYTDWFFGDHGWLLFGNSWQLLCYIMDKVKVHGQHFWQPKDVRLAKKILRYSDQDFSHPISILYDDIQVFRLLPAGRVVEKKHRNNNNVW